MPSYLVKSQTTAPDVDGDVHNYFPGAVLSDWELNEHVKSCIKAGQVHYKRLFEPLTDREAKRYREKATLLAGKRLADNKQVIDPPFSDYVGLHPKDIIERMTKMKPEEVENVRLYESGGLKRKDIMDYVAPSEREPFYGYSDLGVREILSKMDILDAETCQEIIWYEMSHQKRPAVIEYEKEEASPQSSSENEGNGDSGDSLVGAGAPTGIS